MFVFPPSREERSVIYGALGIALRKRAIYSWGKISHRLNKGCFGPTPAKLKGNLPKNSIDSKKFNCT